MFSISVVSFVSKLSDFSKNYNNLLYIKHNEKVLKLREVFKSAMTQKKLVLRGSSVSSVYG